MIEDDDGKETPKLCTPINNALLPSMKLPNLTTKEKSEFKINGTNKVKSKSTPQWATSGEGPQWRRHFTRNFGNTDFRAQKCTFIIRYRQTHII